METIDPLLEVPTGQNDVVPQEDMGQLVGHGCASRLVFLEPSLSKTLGFTRFARLVATVTN